MVSGTLLSAADSSVWATWQAFLAPQQAISECFRKIRYSAPSLFSLFSGFPPENLSLLLQSHMHREGI